MKTCRGSRLFRRSCRPAPLPVTRHQIRQKVDRMRDIYELEDRVAVLRDRNRGDSLTNIAKAHRVSRATVSRLLKQAKDAEPVPI
jgi:DNA-binding transcriptional regulator LsrR (DeoR family)